MKTLMLYAKKFKTGKQHIRKELFIIHVFRILFICLFFITPNAFGSDAMRSVDKCVLPAPDGGNIGVSSPANIHGRISKIINLNVIIQEKFTNKLLKIKLGNDTQLYTVFGGDVPINELQTNQEAWVWYKHCKSPANSIPDAAIIWIFSVDPNDVNPNWKLGPHENTGTYPFTIKDHT